ncbi:MAG: efflux RND transporter periplasmic adaptor subunit [Bacteroidales bacterium]|nr:efflux RND transporter periplasmic adaptor subunit [Anaerotignum sp.]MCI5678512.1 efflux RND transporter periplasmic adaptor subunit [Bacteroidales bacterium]MDY3926356.1 efflux RND transporter periplasmic adaptor subunit [Anaerotignum sp.]
MKLTKKKKIILVAAIAVVVTAGVKLALGSGEPAGEMVSIALAEKQDLQETLRLKAVLEGTESTEVVSRLHYEVKELLVKEGDRVKKGQLLAVLDSTDLSQEMSLKKGSLTLLQKQQAETLRDRQVEYNNAKKAYDDTKALFDIGAASKAELDDAKEKLDAIPAENGKAVLSAVEKQTLANTNQEISIQASTMDDCQIRSMIDGTVTRVNTKVGRFADETEDDKPMFVIENLDTLQMKVMVSENDIAKVSVGQKVDITADILNGESVQGEVIRISPTGELKDGTTSERVIPVYISVKEKNDKLIAGITAKATIHIAEAKQALTVPYEAVGELEDGSTVVYVVNEDNTIHIVPVELGLETDLYVEIKGGELKEGQTIVLNPSPALTEGMAVLPQ